MADNRLFRLYPILAFVVGASLESSSRILNYNYNMITAGLISIFSLAMLMLIFYFLSSKFQ
ncbi:MAG TPA: hypothetical protein VJJ51_13960 [Candidatus Methanoperedens sp.]|nr:hypothetical protein [Candidatus Methanoperedens sp.]HLB72142.1 hypothetical protein [Candidatus Methanoperedens sp.]